MTCLTLISSSIFRCLTIELLWSLNKVFCHLLQKSHFLSFLLSVTIPLHHLYINKINVSVTCFLRTRLLLVSPAAGFGFHGTFPQKRETSLIRACACSQSPNFRKIIMIERLNRYGRPSSFHAGFYTHSQARLGKFEH